LWAPKERAKQPSGHPVQGDPLLAALKKFTGTLVLVSHDRHFLRCLVNRVFEIGQGKMTPYEGDYEYYLSKTGRDHRAI